MSKLGVSSGVAGAIFTIASMLIFLVGIPLLRYVFPLAILLGCAFAVVLRFIRRDTPGKSWLLSATPKEAESPTSVKRDEHPGRIVRLLLDDPTIC